MTPQVTSVSLNPLHTFSKRPVPEIRILAHHGVEGDAHAGEKVQHLYRVRKNPNAPNLCQVHLIAEEFLEELRTQNFPIEPGQLGENIIVRSLDLCSLSVGATLRLGSDALIEITGLRDPCNQLNTLRPGLMKACLARSLDGTLIRKAGVMAIALVSGSVRPGDPIHLTLPPHPHRPMGPV
jgi:MOSC domain-containing protein YiiM